MENSQTPEPSYGGNIGFLDSGIGGLSIMQAVRQQLPLARYFYLADHAFFPYGVKPQDAIVQRVLDIGLKFIAEHQLHVLVIACNTASTAVLPALRARTQIPIVGVVPAIKPAAELSETKVLGLLATEATINREYTDQLIGTFAGECQVVRLGSQRLVQIAEDKLAGLSVDKMELREILEPFVANPRLDTVVLACTHFPFLRDEFAAVFPRPVRWLDSGEAIGRRVVVLTEGLEIHAGSPSVSLHCTMQSCWCPRRNYHSL